MTMTISLTDAQKVWYCQSCAEVVEEPITLYECGDCGTVFSRENSYDGNSHKCPDCSKFAGKLTAHGCGDCEEEDGCEEVMAVDCDGEWVVIEGLAVK